jgi:hypothetical protein
MVVDGFRCRFVASAIVSACDLNTTTPHANELLSMASRPPGVVLLGVTVLQFRLRRAPVTPPNSSRSSKKSPWQDDHTRRHPRAFCHKTKSQHWSSSCGEELWGFV